MVAKLRAQGTLDERPLNAAGASCTVSAVIGPFKN
ncbi:hypothetical protein B0G57_103320 [Trinickia symbiotica]|nr:hypothetical protein B0G57_103320 [Trinickia symbiotica]